MRFQVQWGQGKNRKGDFSEVVENTSENGVTKSQALAALDQLQNKVVPIKVRKSQELAAAIENAKRFIRQASGLPPGTSQSFYIKNGQEVTGGKGARVDVESLSGIYNLTSY